MSEEVEIDKLEKLIDRCNECKFATCENCEINWTEVQAIKGLLNLYKNIKEIEKSHQEENGKLRVELEQYKLLEANIDKANKIIAENKFDEGLYGLLMQEKEKNKELLKEYNKKLQIDWEDAISKDKIKEKIEDYEKMVEGTFKDNTWNGQNRRDNCYEIIRILNELLEEK